MRTDRSLLAAAIVALLSPGLQADNDTLFGNTPVSPERQQAMVDRAQQRLARTNGRPAAETRRAYTDLNNARNAGSAEAWGLMGKLYRGGNGVKPVPFIANDYFWMGALSSDPESMYQTAQRRFNTPGGYREGVEWLKRAADAGHPQAAFDWALREFKACQDRVGQEYLAVAINGGLDEAKYFLADSYLTGENGFERSPVRAFGVYKQMADAGNARAKYLIGRLFQYGTLGGDEAANQRAAVYWYSLSAEQQYRPGIEAYAAMLEIGDGTQKDIAEARWLRRYSSALERNERNPARVLIGLSALERNGE